jgi:hypothetical protein
VLEINIFKNVCSERESMSYNNFIPGKESWSFGPLIVYFESADKLDGCE